MNTVGKDSLIGHETVDVVIPVYNSARYLKQCLDSFISQTYTDFKIFVVYDKSVDNSLSILQEYQKKFSTFFTILYSPKKDGLGAARDFALDSGLLLGDFVIFPDSDDYVEPTYLEKLVFSAKTHKSDIAFCGFERFDNSTGRTISIDMVHNHLLCSTPDQCKSLLYLNAAAWNKLFRLELFKNNRFTNIKCSEDFFCFMRILPQTKRLSFINESLYHYRIRNDSLSNTYRMESANEMYYGFEQTLLFYQQSSFSKYYMSFLSAQAFLRLAIGVVVRVTKSDRKLQSTIIKSVSRYLAENFPKWYKSKFLSFSFSCGLGFKALLVWVAKVLFRLHLFWLYLLIYRLYVKLLKKDVRW